MSLGKIIFIILLLAIVIAAAIFGPRFYRVNQMIHLYDEGKISENFINMDKIFDTIPLSASPITFTFDEGTFDLPETFILEGKEQNLQEALDYFETDGLIVLSGNKKIYENYWHGNTKDSKHISWSVAKSFLSAMIGIAVNDGLININEPITKYLPEFNGTGYEGVRVKDILQMSSGVRFNEDYGDYNSDINRFGRAISMGTSMKEFALTLTNEKTPGTFNHYVSIDTQMLAMLLQEVTQISVTDYLQEKIWNPLGMESDAYYLIDNTGMEVALGGLNATLRDYAKFGLLYLQRGNWEGEQVVPAAWVDESHYPDSPHLQPGENPYSSSSWGYGYQWWVPGFPDTDYTAAGVYNQYIYIDPVTNVVVAKTSSNHKFTAEREYSKAAHIAMFRAIVKAVAEQ
jgi:CubicO group peptidase (beta-lactamase class C family)